MNPRLPFLLAALALCPATFAFSDEAEPAEVDPKADEASDPKAEGKGADDKEKKPKTIEELTKDSDLIEGLLPIYRDRKTGATRLLLNAQQLDKPYLYFTYIENGVSDAGWLTRGSYYVAQAKVIRLQRYFDRIEFIEENTSYYFDPNKAIARAADANISHAVLFSEKIESEDEDKRQILIKADKLFVTEALQRFAPLPNPDKKPHEVFSLGKRNESKSKIKEIRSYPKNTDVVVEYVFENEQPFVRGSDAVTDPRYVSVVAQHSFIEAPADPMTPRFDDPRVGYFLTEVTDLSSTETIPYRDVIRRWRLEKKDPAQEKSEPVTPIVFWIENTTPRELRPIIEDAALRWNEAFETAGFINAIQVQTQPDDAEWNAGDLRYNVIRWVSSPNPMYGGYGPSFSDPRSGEMLGADIMLEYSVISRSLREFDLLGETGAMHAHAAHHPAACTASLHARAETLFAMSALEAFGGDETEKQRLLEEFIYFLTLHEIGHTLGLSHNFRSSHLHSLEDIFDPEKTYPVGLYGSVMDYPAVPFRLPGEGSNQYWTTRAGPYDHWAIDYGYSTPLEDPAAEQARLEAILSRSTEPALAFGNDADDMRAPGKAIDPRAMVGDQTSDPIGFALHQSTLVKTVLPALAERTLNPGESTQGALNGYWSALWRYRESMHTISRFIGGVQVDRSMIGQAGASQPLVPVSAEQQRRALQALASELFAADAFDTLAAPADHLLAQRRGWNHGGSTEDPKLHQNALDIQKSVLEHLLHPLVLARIGNTALYGNAYPLPEYLSDLSDAIFAADLEAEVNTFRQQLQLEYVDRLLKIVNGDPYDRVSQSLALNRLRWIEANAGETAQLSLSTQAHREHLLHRIERGLKPSS